ncbi:hypothetical protein Krac_5993 [Ktedonobacter racemifer DSM 44963]|uniref:Uncharacterized protein n=1 Tax=Ktedonobacter racemifer DSM 44963 TaxID=485913 RepID=D6TXE4_KTERA|nr:hypothetical protein Krac_5993 [Ktedonobacter racemifer DSM 44963]
MRACIRYAWIATFKTGHMSKTEFELKRKELPE